MSSKEDVDEGFVINQEGIGLRLTAMEYWKCNKVGIVLPSADEKEPDCKFVIAESLPKQGNGSRAVYRSIPPLPGFGMSRFICSCVLALIFRQEPG